MKSPEEMIKITPEKERSKTWVQDIAEEESEKLVEEM